MINNFEQIKTLLNFDSQNDFYFIQIIKRRKDNPDLARDMKLIDSFFCYRLEDLDKLAPNIIEKCDMNNARAYIHLNRRDAENVALHTAKKIMELILCNDFKAVKSAYHSTCGSFHAEPQKRWVVDIDVPEEDWVIEMYDDQMREFINSLQPVGRKILARIPTKNGYHLITTAFNKFEFAKKYPRIDIHTDNPTLLYIP